MEYKVHNKELQEKCKGFINGALMFLRNKLAQGETPSLIIEEKIFIEELYDSALKWSRSIVEIPSLVSFVNRYENELMQLPDYRQCEEILHRDPVIDNQLNTYFGTVNERSWLDCKSILFSILRNIILNKENLDFDSEDFERAYLRVEESLYNEKLKFQLIVPLENFRCDNDEIDLSEGIRIVKLPKSHLEELCTIALSEGISYRNIFSVRFALKKIYEEGKAPLRGEIELVESLREFPPVSQRDFEMNELDLVIAAMRIFSNGDVYYTLYRNIPLSWMPDHRGDIVVSGKVELSDSLYNLNSENLKEFVKFWSILKEARTKKFLFLDEAISRFNFSYFKGNYDKLIDYMICFEILLLKDYAELSYRLSLRVAVLIEENREKRKEIFLNVRDAYEVRNKIVHGGNREEIDKLVKKKFNDLSTLISKIGDYLRCSIKEIILLINKNYKKEEILEMLDGKILK